MKRLGSSDSLGALMSICPPTATDEQSPRTNDNNNHMYSREFQTILDGLDNEEGCVEESGGGHINLLGEKKRRLNVDQVKALEKNFEVENKLEPERKVKLAQELGLQPRQVAVWFQNRRARWKTKQLEKDYGVLKASYDSLKLNFDALKHDNDALLKEIRELKAKLNEENAESNVSVKEEIFLPESDHGAGHDHGQTEPLILGPINAAAISETEEDLNYESFNSNNEGLGASILIDNFKDGSSTDGDSSAVFNEDSNNNGNSNKSPNSNSFQFSKTTSFHTQLVKMEEHDFFSSHEEACNFFSDVQAPTLHWYCPDQWNYETS